MPIVVMEKTFPEPASDELIDQMRQATETCLEINGATRKCTYASDDRRRFVCVIEALDLESVRRAFDSAKMVPDKLYSATSF